MVNPTARAQPKGQSAFSQFWSGGGEGQGDYMRDMLDEGEEIANIGNIINDVTEEMGGFNSALAQAGGLMGNLVSGSMDFATAFKKIGAFLLQLLAGTATGGASSLLSFGAGFLGSMDSGGITRREGFAYLHPNEAVIPLSQAGGMGGGGVIINNTHIHAGSVISERGLRSRIQAGQRRGR